jgi:tetratricopeptide (TPR) repeat protein
MAIEGALQDVSLADICQLLGMGRKTGCLSVTDRSNFGYIYFQHGRVIHASVLNRPDRLGELLVRNEVISRQELATAVRKQVPGRRKRLGEILVEQGRIDHGQLKKYIHKQIEEAVYHLFTWNQGSFHFDSDQMPDEEGAFLVDISAESLLMEGARQVDEWSLFERKIPSFDLVFQLDKDPGEAEEEFELSPEQQKVIPLLDGVRTVTEIMTEAGLVAFDAAQSLYGLIQAGFVSRAGEKTTAAEVGGDQEIQEHLNLAVAFYQSGMMEDAEREVGIVLQIDPEQARGHFLLGLIALRARRPDDALRHFDAMPEGSRSAYAVHRNRGLALDMKGRFDDAIGAFEAAHLARPDDPDVHLLKAIVHLERRDAKSALRSLRSYRAAPKLTRPSHVYYAYAVLAAVVAGDLDRAVAIGREGLSHFPESGPVLVNTGVVLERRGELAAAEALFKRAVSVRPAPAQAHKNLGDQAWARGDHGAARIQYEKAVKLAPRLGDDVFLRLGTLAYKEDERDVALLLWRRALEMNPHNEAVRANLETLEA